ncbi:uncharacterized protein LOC117570555 [Drosophila albomicans]|uniref:Uncharacterized protein LOC117570555 n=1 Tax=Drosophila albomicans TaxID=7291 RepID=A0A6P8YPP3_DROAB|nr:uncharacterized protein LOC117570555 [Drosophila albomicans]
MPAAERFHNKPMIWLIRHENILFTLWEEESKKVNYSGNYQNIYQAIAEKLCKAGLQIQWKDVRTRIESVTKKYNEELRDIEALGRPSSWRHFERVHKILGVSPQSIESIESNGVATLLDDEQYGLDDLPNSETSSVAEPNDNNCPDSVSASPSPEKKRRKLGNTSKMTPFELAMLEIERDRTVRLESIAMNRLEVMKRMAAENAEFHKKLLALVKSRK